MHGYAAAAKVAVTAWGPDRRLPQEESLGDCWHATKIQHQRGKVKLVSFKGRRVARGQEQNHQRVGTGTGTYSYHASPKKSGVVNGHQDAYANRVTQTQTAGLERHRHVKNAQAYMWSQLNFRGRQTKTGALSTAPVFSPKRRCYVRSRLGVGAATDKRQCPVMCFRKSTWWMAAFPAKYI